MDNTSDVEPQQDPIEPVAPHTHIGTTVPTKRTYHRGSFFWPITLIGFGVVLLLSNIGFIPATGWAILWRFWPIALIALGLDVLIGRRSLAGAIASGILILVLVGVAIGISFFAERIPSVINMYKPGGYTSQAVSHPLGDIASADVTIEWTSMPAQLHALSDSVNLIEAEVTYQGELEFTVNQTTDQAQVLLDAAQPDISFVGITPPDLKWLVGLNSEVYYTLNLDVHAGSCVLDLSGLKVERLELDGGSGDTILTLPAKASLKGVIDGSSGALTVQVPAGVGLRIELEKGSGSFDPGEKLIIISGEPDDDAIWETVDYANAEYQITLEVDQSSGSIIIQ